MRFTKEFTFVYTFDEKSLFTTHTTTRELGLMSCVYDPSPFRSLMTDVFPGINYAQSEMEGLKKIVADVCREKHLVCGLEEEECGHSWTEKVRCSLHFRFYPREGCSYHKHKVVHQNLPYCLFTYMQHICFEMELMTKYGEHPD